MGWPFTDIAEELSRRSLQLPELSVLTPAAGAYEVLAIQPAGPIAFKDDFVGHGDKALAQAKFDTFLNLSIEKNSDLTLSPEYSCPWTCIEDALRDGRLPARGKLWALGCESIKPSELDALVGRLNHIRWIYETPSASSHVFLDAVCYVFGTTTTDGEDCHVALLQFKTVPMGGKSTFERDRLILGSKRYFLRNGSSNYIRILTLLCSEALNFQIDDAAAQEFQQHPSIVFHPQLAEDSRHEDMRRYRADLYRNLCSSNLEILSLNWARETRDRSPTETIMGNSSIFMKSEQFVRTDDRLQKNHLLGMYYSNWRKYYTEISSLNHDEYAFHFETYRPALVGASVQLRRTGPEMLSALKWNSEARLWEGCDRADDGFGLLCESYGDPSLKLCAEDHFPAVHIERLLTLSAGKMEPVEDWHDVRKMPSFQAEADERTKRLTFVHEQHSDSRDFRNICLTRYVKLISNILREPSNFPECIGDLAGNFRVVAPTAATEFRQNLSSESEGASGATAVFLGSQTDAYAAAFFDQVRMAWGRDQRTLKQEHSRRLVIWYERPSGGIRSLQQPLGEITDDSEVPASIVRGEDK